RLTIRWTPGHVDVAGNERADTEAKRAAQEGSSARKELPHALRQRLPRSKAAARQDNMAQLKAEIRREWTLSPRYERIRRYDPKLPSDAYLTLAARI
ncbi:hypothetical protein B0H10DRAFT_1692727, partial [Mycena sp. CBHHK59/15]